MELTRTRIVRGEVSVETTYDVSSLRAGVRRLMAVVREHWGVENVLHWTLDAQMREDDCRVYDENGAQNLATLRGLALMLLKRDTSFKAGIARKQGRVARKVAYREHVLTLVFQGD
jgi:predicted transposase YbfD/YdcC